MPYNNHCCAGVAHLVERDLAKVEVASSSLVARSKKETTIRQDSGFFFCQVGQRLERARAQREKHAGGMFWCPCACGGPARPPASLVARSRKETTIRQDSGFFFCQVGQRLERARAQREKHAGGMFWCPCACGGPARPPASLVARSRKKDTRRGVFLFGAALLLRKSGRLRAGDLTCKGNPTKVSLAYIPFLAIYRSAHGQQNL